MHCLDISGQLTDYNLPIPETMHIYALLNAYTDNYQCNSVRMILQLTQDNAYNVMLIYRNIHTFENSTFTEI